MSCETDFSWLLINLLRHTSKLNDIKCPNKGDWKHYGHKCFQVKYMYQESNENPDYAMKLSHTVP